MTRPGLGRHAGLAAENRQGPRGNLWEGLSRPDRLRPGSTTGQIPLYPLCERGALGGGAPFGKGGMGGLTRWAWQGTEPLPQDSAGIGQTRWSAPTGTVRVAPWIISMAQVRCHTLALAGDGAPAL